MQTLVETRKSVVIVMDGITSLSVLRENQLRKRRPTEQKRNRRTSQKMNFVEPPHLLELEKVACCYKLQERMQLMGQRQFL